MNQVPKFKLRRDPSNPEHYDHIQENYQPGIYSEIIPGNQQGMKTQQEENSLELLSNLVSTRITSPTPSSSQLRKPYKIYRTKTFYNSKNQGFWRHPPQDSNPPDPHFQFFAPQLEYSGKEVKRKIRKSAIRNIKPKLGLDREEVDPGQKEKKIRKVTRISNPDLLLSAEEGIEYLRKIYERELEQGEKANCKKSNILPPWKPKSSSFTTKPPKIYISDLPILKATQKGRIAKSVPPKTIQRLVKVALYGRVNAIFQPPPVATSSEPTISKLKEDEPSKEPEKDDECERIQFLTNQNPLIVLNKDPRNDKEIKLYSNEGFISIPNTNHAKRCSCQELCLYNNLENLLYTKVCLPKKYSRTYEEPKPQAIPKKSGKDYMNPSIVFFGTVGESGLSYPKIMKNQSLANLKRSKPEEYNPPLSSCEFRNSDILQDMVTQVYRKEFGKFTRRITETDHEDHPITDDNGQNHYARFCGKKKEKEMLDVKILGPTESIESRLINSVPVKIFKGEFDCMYCEQTIRVNSATDLTEHLFQEHKNLTKSIMTCPVCINVRILDWKQYPEHWTLRHEPGINLMMVLDELQTCFRYQYGFALLLFHQFMEKLNEEPQRKPLPLKKHYLDPKGIGGFLELEPELNSSHKTDLMNYLKSSLTARRTLFLKRLEEDKQSEEKLSSEPEQDIGYFTSQDKYEKEKIRQQEEANQPPSTITSGMLEESSNKEIFGIDTINLPSFTATKENCLNDNEAFPSSSEYNPYQETSITRNVPDYTPSTRLPESDQSQRAEVTFNPSASNLEASGDFNFYYSFLHDQYYEPAPHPGQSNTNEENHWAKYEVPMNPPIITLENQRQEGVSMEVIQSFNLNNADLQDESIMAQANYPQEFPSLGQAFKPPRREPRLKKIERSNQSARMSRDQKPTMGLIPKTPGKPANPEYDLMLHTPTPFFDYEN